MEQDQDSELSAARNPILYRSPTCTWVASMFPHIQRAQGFLMPALFYYMQPWLGKVSHFSGFFYMFVLMPLAPS